MLWRVDLAWFSSGFFEIGIRAVELRDPDPLHLQDLRQTSRISLCITRSCHTPETPSKKNIPKETHFPSPCPLLAQHKRGEKFSLWRVYK